jgi:hypothetical protein
MPFEDGCRENIIAATKARHAKVHISRALTLIANLPFSPARSLNTPALVQLETLDQYQYSKVSDERDHLNPGLVAAKTVHRFRCGQQVLRGRSDDASADRSAKLPLKG